MVRPFEDDYLCPAWFAPGGVRATHSKDGSTKRSSKDRSCSPFYIPGLRTADVAVVEEYLRSVNIMPVFLDIKMPRKSVFTLRETFYVLYGGTPVKELSELVCYRLNLEEGRPMQFLMNGDLLAEATTVSAIYEKHLLSDNLATLQCYIDKKKFVPRSFNVDKSVKVPIVEPVYVNEEYIPFPPFRIRNIRDAKKAAADARSGSYGNATISHGSYSEEGHLQFY
ncbi:hypothetical protein CFC21_094737 [Triticum aestivum]|uniref:Uncharacterized protein n=2 Tax=Triticum aestivum TaxID=4565 RepID=A0A3B6QLC9_WHEAT|nr:uncharacterized protein LOC123146269 [Triticum aestivum]KAF7092232.1 hypothetical protein CFC21_094737 [Triticum aestivum]